MSEGCLVPHELFFLGWQTSLGSLREPMCSDSVPAQLLGRGKPVKEKCPGGCVRSFQPTGPRPPPWLLVWLRLSNTRV